MNEEKERLKMRILFIATMLRKYKKKSQAEIREICLTASNGTPSEKCSITQLKDVIHFLWREFLRIKFDEIKSESRRKQ